MKPLLKRIHPDLNKLIDDTAKKMDIPATAASQIVAQMASNKNIINVNIYKGKKKKINPNPDLFMI